MILIYPLLVIVALVVVWRTKASGSAGWPGFMAWCIAGALFTFSLFTGLSIGLLVLPLVVLAIYRASRSAPHRQATLGFVAGIGLILLVIASIHSAETGWLVPGIVLSSVGLSSFAGLRWAAGRHARLRP